MKNYDRIAVLFLEHIEIVVLSFLLSLVIAVPLGILAAKVKPLAPIFNTAFNIIFSIPSMAMFALFIPLFGLGKATAVVVLSFYNQIILLRSITEGFQSVDPAVLESAGAMGMTKGQVFRKVEFPLALPTLCTGVRLSVLSTISMATLAAVISAGGLGRLLFDGLRQNYFVKIYWGAILAAVLAFLASAILKKVENAAIRYAGGEETASFKKKI